MSGVIFGFTNPYEGKVTIDFTKCDCGCKERFNSEDMTRILLTGEMIAHEHLDYYNELIEKERIENL